MSKEADKKRPAPAATGDGPKETSSTNNSNDGEAGKQLAFELFCHHRAELIRRVIRLMVQIATEQGSATTDDVRAWMEILTDQNPEWVGAVPGILARKGIIGSGRSDKAEASATMTSSPSRPDRPSSRSGMLFPEAFSLEPGERPAGRWDGRWRP